MLRSTDVFGVLGAGVLQLACAIGIGGLAVLGAGSSVRADEACDVLDVAPEGDHAACGQAADLDLSLPAPNAAGIARSSQGDAKLPAEAPSLPLPLAITPAQTGGGARASLQTLRDYNAQKTARKIEGARAVAPDALPAPKSPVFAKSALDVWSSVDAQGFDAEDSRTLKTGAGLDYKIVESARVGVAAERSQQAREEAPLGAATGEKVSAYVAFRALPMMSIDARTQWERASTFDAATENSTGAEKSSVIVAPRIGHAFSLESGQTLEPYLEVKRQIDLAGGGDADTLAASDSAGAGVNIAKPGSYAVSVTTGVNGLGGREPADLNSKVQLKVPLD